MRRHPDMHSVYDRWSLGDVGTVSIGMAVGTILVVAAAWIALKFAL